MNTIKNTALGLFVSTAAFLLSSCATQRKMTAEKRNSLDAKADSFVVAASGNGGSIGFQNWKNDKYRAETTFGMVTSFYNDNCKEFDWVDEHYIVSKASSSLYLMQEFHHNVQDDTKPYKTDFIKYGTCDKLNQNGKEIFDSGMKFFLPTDDVAKMKYMASAPQ